MKRTANVCLTDNVIYTYYAVLKTIPCSSDVILHQYYIISNLELNFNDLCVIFKEGYVRKMFSKTWCFKRKRTSVVVLIYDTNKKTTTTYFSSLYSLIYIYEYKFNTKAPQSWVKYLKTHISRLVRHTKSVQLHRNDKTSYFFIWSVNPVGFLHAYCCKAILNIRAVVIQAKSQNIS